MIAKSHTMKFCYCVILTLFFVRCNLPESVKKIDLENEASYAVPLGKINYTRDDIISIKSPHIIRFSPLLKDRDLTYAEKQSGVFKRTDKFSLHSDMNPFIFSANGSIFDDFVLHEMKLLSGRIKLTLNYRLDEPVEMEVTIPQITDDKGNPYKVTMYLAESRYYSIVESGNQDISGYTITLENNNAELQHKYRASLGLGENLSLVDLQNFKITLEDIEEEYMRCSFGSFNKGYTREFSIPTGKDLSHISQGFKIIFDVENKFGVSDRITFDSFDFITSDKLTTLPVRFRLEGESEDNVISMDEAIRNEDNTLIPVSNRFEISSENSNMGELLEGGDIKYVYISFSASLDSEVFFVNDSHLRSVIKAEIPLIFKKEFPILKKKFH